MNDGFPTGIGLGARTAFLEALAAGEGQHQIAFLEVTPENFLRRGGRGHAWLAQAAEHHRVITHGVTLSLGGHDAFVQQDLLDLRAFLTRFNTPWHSDHLCWSGHGGSWHHDLLPLPFTRTTAMRVSDRIRAAQDALGVPIAVENISWYAELGPCELSEADFIAEIVERADCGLMLDVNNAFVNARNHGFDAQAWLDRLPLERVVQLHVAGHEPWDETLFIDTHGAEVLPEVHALLRHVISRVGPKPVVLERDNNIPPLATLLAEVAALQRTYDDALSTRQS